MTDKINIEIDGRTCEASPGEMIIAVADRAGIVIPRFCYHEKLSVAANCRMCLVEAEQGGRPFPKPVPACATPVAPGMKIATRSPKALEAQRGTMEFLLINHPLDCPICDQGGECELQDVAMGYGASASRYAEGKRVVMDQDLGPLIATEMTRCIHCTRCVRFGAEIAGVRELGATGRGENMRIGTFVAHTVAHELSGNVIDLCPVGALTSKPYRFSARAWELTQTEGIAPHDSLGSNLKLHLRGNRVMRVHPRDNEAVNETWISDRDRFSYQGLASADRLQRPLVKRDGTWHETDWQEALRLAAEGLKAVAATDPAQLGCLISPSATLEELYLAQKLVRGLGSANIDHRLRQRDTSADALDAPLPWLGLPVAGLEALKAVLLIGSDIRQEQPLLAHRIRKAVGEGATVGLVNPLALELTFPATQCVVSPAALLGELAGIAKALNKRGSGTVKTLIAAATANDTHKAIASALREAGAEGAVLMGALAAAHPDYGLLKALARVIAAATQAKVGFLPAGANGVGAYLAGAIPAGLPGALPADGPGLGVHAMLDQPRKGYLLWGLEPGLDLGNPGLGLRALGQAGCVVACTAFRSPSLEAVAQVMLPIAAFAETSGTFVNAEGAWQGFRGAVAPPGEARPGWKVLRVLGNLLDLPGFEFNESAEVREELRALCTKAKPDNTPRGDLQALSPSPSASGSQRVGTLPIYAVDPLVRRAQALQASPLAAPFGVWLNADDAAGLGLKAGDQVQVRQDGDAVTATLALDPALPAGSVRIPAGVPGSEALGDQIAVVTVSKAATGGA
jgi:NADH-quinone oxidoreductase subunit G